MSVRTAGLKAVHAARKLLGPTATDLHTHRVIVRTRTWPGGDNGPEVRYGATYTDSDLEILPRPHVRETPGGGLLVGPITPAHAGGGYTVDQLNPAPSLTAGQEVLYVVIGPGGTRTFAAVEIDERRSFRYMLHLTSLERAVPA